MQRTTWKIQKFSWRRKKKAKKAQEINENFNEEETGNASVLSGM